MGLSLTEIARSVFGNKRVVITEIAFDSTYPTGGESLTPALVGLASIDAVIPAGPAAAAAGAAAVSVKYDRTNKKLQAFRSGAVAATVTLDSHTHTVAVSGDPETATTSGTVATGTVSTLAATSLAEVANAVDLSALKVVVFVVGS